MKKIIIIFNLFNFRLNLVLLARGQNKQKLNINNGMFVLRNKGLRSEEIMKKYNKEGKL